jgi:hypothetical protein
LNQVALVLDPGVGSRCTIEYRNHQFCDRPVMRDAPFPICSNHAVTIYRHMAGLVDEAAHDPVRMMLVGLDEMDALRAARTKRRMPAPDPTDPVVYYLMIDGLVKIGFASNIAKRLASYPPNSRLLGTEPGGRDLESTRHREFAEYLSAGREWFTPGPRLRHHIEGLPDYQAA